MMATLSEDLAAGEGLRIEFMQGFPDQARDLVKEIAAFASVEGGTIYLGVTDEGQPVGLEEDVETGKGHEEMRKRIRGIVSSKITPSVVLEIEFPRDEKGGVTVVAIKVPKGSEPIYYCEGRPYLRYLDESRLATPEEVKQIFWEYYHQYVQEIIRGIGESAVARALGRGGELEGEIVRIIRDEIDEAVRRASMYSL